MPLDLDDEPRFDGTLVREVCRAVEAAGYPQLVPAQYAALAGVLHDCLYSSSMPGRDPIAAMTEIYGLGFEAGEKHGTASARRAVVDPEPGMAERVRARVDAVMHNCYP